MSGLVLLLSLVVAASNASAARFLHFQAVSRPQGAELVAAGKVLLRLRPGMPIYGKVNALADDLNQLAFAGLKGGSLTVRSVSGGVQIVAGTSALITVDKQTAQLGGSATPQALAAGWVRSLRDVLDQPYVVLEPRGRLQVPLGEVRVVRWGGSAATELTFAVGDATVAAVDLDESGSALRVRGLTIGNTSLTAKIEGDSVQLPVEVKAWAARVAPAAVAEVTSPPLPADDLRRTVRNAVLCAVQPAAGASIELGEPRAIGDRFEVAVRASGPGCFEVNAAVPVSLKVVPLPAAPVQQLLVSNLPEKITEPATLLRERLVGKAPVRLLWHHVNKSPRPLRFAVRLTNLGDKPARLHVTESATGPHDDEIFVGHQAMMRFMALIEQGEGYLLTVPAGRMLDLYDIRLPGELIVSGLARVTPVDAGNLMLEVVAEDTWPTDAYFAPAPDRLRNDPPLTPYRFEAEKEVDVKYLAGDGWAFYQIGKEFSTNLQGQKLYGDYGVRYTITINCKNPTADTAKCAISLRAGGGVARVSYNLHGRLQETGLLRPLNEQVIERLDLAPGEERVVKLITIPESGSNLPIQLTVRNP